MGKFFPGAFVVIACWPALFAQHPPFGVYGLNVEERAATRIGYWREDVNEGYGEVVLTYGRPLWKPEYEEGLDTLTRGKLWRMGDNYWSLLDTQLPITVGGVSVEPGFYYLAIGRSEDGEQWHLVFIDAARARQRLLDSYDVGTRPGEIPVLFKTPLEFESREEPAEKLTILFSLREGSKTEGRMELTWGPFALTTPIEIHLP